jgi:peptidoglycan/xylan/chitin deacetylase (PgdA/CDA1 family)
MARVYRRRDVLVLAYHAVSEVWPAPLAVTTKALRSQLTYLVTRGYRGVTLREALRSGPAARVVAVTFDDAFRSVLDLALPVLTELGLPATVFAPTDFVGTPGPMSWPGIDEWLDGPYTGELACMSWSDLSTLADAGWEIGSHTRSHPFLTRLDDDRLQNELAKSREICERRLGRPCVSLAYPYGDVDERVVQAARAAGYEAACTLPDRLDSTEPLTYGRVGVYRADTMSRFRVKASPLARRLSAIGALEPLIDCFRRA